jgi:hypothetical protein
MKDGKDGYIIVNGSAGVIRFTFISVNKTLLGLILFYYVCFFLFGGSQVIFFTCCSFFLPTVT